MSTVSTVTAVMLVAAVALFALRLVRGPSLADRINALNGVVVVGMAALALHARITGRGSFLPVVVTLALVSFIGTAVIARYIEGREP